MFDKLMQDIQGQQEDKLVDININNNPALNADLFRQKMNDINNIPEAELFTIIKSSIGRIIDDVINDREGSYYINAFVNPKFLITLTQLISSSPITYEIRTCCNKLAYDFLTMKTHDASIQDPSYIKQLFVSLCRIVNRQVYPLLLGIGLPESIALNMSIARFSTTNEMISVKRLNFVIANAPREIMNLQSIVFIYEKLFDRMTPIFKGVMFDVFDTDEEWVTEEICEAYSTIEIAMLGMLNNMPSVDIRKILMDYAGDLKMLYNSDRRVVRLSLHAMSQDFGKIVNCAEVLNSEGFYIP